MPRRELTVCLLVLASDVCTAAVCSPRLCMCQSNKRKHNPFHHNKNCIFIPAMTKRSCGSVVEHCISNAKGCGLNSQGTHILTKKIITCVA